jgi:hypothetical protein
MRNYEETLMRNWEETLMRNWDETLMRNWATNVILTRYTQVFQRFGHHSPGRYGRLRVSSHVLKETKPGWNPLTKRQRVDDWQVYGKDA